MNKKLSNAQFYLLGRGANDLLLRNHHDDILYASDAMEEYLKSNLSTDEAKKVFAEIIYRSLLQYEYAEFNNYDKAKLIASSISEYFSKEKGRDCEGKD